jgi:phytoene dehydrogenase-like protein
MYSQWRDVMDIDRLKLVPLNEMVTIQTERGDRLPIPTNIELLEKDLTARFPRDKKAIRRFAADLRSLSKFRMPVPGGSAMENFATLVHDLPRFPLFRRLAHMSCKEYGKSFSDPVLRSFFGDGEMGNLVAIALFFSIAWMNSGDASYVVGGSQAIIRQIEEKLTSLGGHVRFNAKVERILLENDRAIGVELSDGERILADWVISAADGYATLYKLLGGKYKNKALDKLYAKPNLFPSYLQVSLGVGMDLSAQPGLLTRILDSPLYLDPITELNQVSFRFFHFDPTFAPPGKTAVTCFLPTWNHEYWTSLRQKDDAAYRAEKQRVASEVIAILERTVVGIHDAIEIVDVATPATVIRYTGNWHGTMEGWFMSPGQKFSSLPNTLSGLRNFVMAGQWISPGGGLPCGPMTARVALQTICKADGVEFASQPRPKPLTPAPLPG